MKPRCQILTAVCLPILLVFIFSGGPAFGGTEDPPSHTMHAWNAGYGQAEQAGSPAAVGWPGIRPRYQYPPYHPYPPYYYYPHPQYERERTWYEGDLPTSAGRLFFLVEPVQAEAFINDYPLRRHADLSYEISLLKGEHQLEVRAEGYEPYRRVIEIRGGEQISLTIRLEQAGSR